MVALRTLGERLAKLGVEADGTSTPAGPQKITRFAAIGYQPRPLPPPGRLRCGQ